MAPRQHTIEQHGRPPALRGCSSAARSAGLFVDVTQLMAPDFRAPGISQGMLDVCLASQT